MDIWDLVILVVVIYAAYKAGQYSVIVPLMDGIQREIDAGRLTLDDDEDDERRVRIERHEDVYYAYAMDGDFLAQGTTFVELFDRFHSRFPTESFRVQKSTSLSEAERDQMITALEQLANKINAKSL